MKEKPILFSTPMVKAILEGRKTMTRRIFKNPMKKYIGYRNRCAGLLDETSKPLTEKEFYELYSPYTKGDVLWVRETWSVIDWPDGTTARKYETVYKATPPVRYPYKIKWAPSIHLMKNKARLFLKVESVHVERLHAITETDAEKEGVEKIPLFIPGGKYSKGMIPQASYKAGFYKIWEELNGKREFGWDRNPWVWAIEFIRVEK